MAEADVSAHVRALLGTLYANHAAGHVLDRRRDRRVPYPYLVRLLPVAVDGVTAAGPAVVVVGKYLSVRGLGFYHPEPLPHRLVIATLETFHGERLSLLADLNWCRFAGRGWYESGGRFIEIVAR